MIRAIKQIGYNLFLIIISAGVIYVTECIRYGSCVGFEKCINSEFLFVMITSLLTVVFWRALEDISVKGFFNFLGLIVSGICFFIYGAAIVNPRDYMYEIVLGGFFLICVAYIVENVIVISHYAKHGQGDDCPDNLMHDKNH